MEGPWVPLQEFFVFSMLSFKGTLEVSSLQETTASSHSSTPDLFCPSPPPSPAAPQASQLDKQRLQSLTALQCLPARRQHREMLPEQPAVGGRSCCSPCASTGIAPLPARSASKHTGSGGANCKCGSSVRARMRNLVIWKLWVRLLAGLHCGMGLETFSVAFIASFLTHPFSVYMERGPSTSPMQHHLCLTPKEPAVRRGGTPNKCNLYSWLSRLLAPGCLWSSLEFTTKTWPTWGPVSTWLPQTGWACKRHVTWGLHAVVVW